MEKNAFLKFANLLGFQINEEALAPVKHEYDMDKPDNWDEMSEDEKAAWKKEHMKSNSSDPEPEPKPTKPEPKANADEGEMAQLVAEFGGAKGIRTLLSNAKQIVDNQREAEKTERANLVAEIVLNSSETLKEEDLEDTPIALLNKMAEALRPTGFESGVDYSLLGGRKVTKNSKNEVAPRPVHFARQPVTKEAKNDG